MASDNNILRQKGLYLLKPCTRKLIGFLSHQDPRLKEEGAKALEKICDPEAIIPLTEAMRHDPFFCKDSKFKKYKGLPNSFFDIRKWRIVYRELVAQYVKFIEVTDGKADYKHIDFHLWYNLTWPVSVALNLFTRKYRIESVRYIGIHQKKSQRFKLLFWLSRNHCVKYIPATNIDYFFEKYNLFANYPIVELYCHPHYKNGVFLDDSPSYFKHDRQPMLKHIQMLKELGDIDLISWEDDVLSE